MRYVSPFQDPEVRAELLADLSGLSVGSAFLLASQQQVDRILKLCDDAAQKVYNDVVASGKAAEVECITLEAPFFVGFDCFKPLSDLPEDVIVVPVYRYFDTPREAIVAACIMAPNEMTKTRQVTFFCGPDRRKTGDYRIFSLHPGPKRQVFPNRYQPEAVRRANREYWDRHVFLATPNQIITAKMMMREHYKELEQEARDRIFHATRQMEAALHRWYGTWERKSERGEDLKSILQGRTELGDYALTPDGTVYYYITTPGQAPPDFSDRAQVEPRLSNARRPSVIYANGGVEYFVDGKIHREGAPAVFEPQPDGGWIEYWYEFGLISRQPEEGPAKIVYNAKGEVEQEISIFKGAEIEQAILGDAAADIKLLQAQLRTYALDLTWWEESQDFALLRSQIEFAVNRTHKPIAEIVREMQPKADQVSLRWDFDRTLEQDANLKAKLESLTEQSLTIGAQLIKCAQAMRFVRGDPVIINVIWSKIIRDLERVFERGYKIPSITPGLTLVDGLAESHKEAKNFFQSATDSSKAFSATGK